MGATVLLVIIIVFMLAGRLRERSTLGQILAVSQSEGQNYAKLLSKDKSDSFNKNNVSDTGSAPAGENRLPANTGSSVVSTASPTSSSPDSNAATTPPVSNNTGGSTPAIKPVFGASINDFRQDGSAELQCTSGRLNLSKCAKTYHFAANVLTVNGPGSVSYEWQYSINGSVNGSFAAGAGTNTTTLRNELIIDCRDAGNYTAKFVINSPGSSQSQILQISHNCVL